MAAARTRRRQQVREVGEGAGGRSRPDTGAAAPFPVMVDGSGEGSRSAAMLHGIPGRERETEGEVRESSGRRKEGAGSPGTHLRRWQR